MATLLDIVKKGSVDRSVTIRIIDSADGTPETGVAFDTPGIDLWYRREGSAKVSITEATLAALTTAHTDGGFLHISDGEYRLDPPDAAFATGANHVDFGGTVTGMVVIGGRVRLVNYDPEDTVRLGLTALPNAAADAAGGLPISDAGGLDLDAKLAVATSALATPTNITAGTITTVTNLTNAPTAGDLTATMKSSIAASAVASVTGAVGSVTGNVGGNVAGSVGSVTGNVTGSIGSLAAQAKADVNAEADTAISDAALATAANLALAKTVVDAIKVITDALGATAAARLNLSATQIIPGTVDTVTNGHTPTTTVFQADDITEATADHYNGRIVIFTSGALAGQATSISDYAAVGGIGQLTVVAMTEAPANDDTFIIL